MDKTFEWFTKADLREYQDQYVSIVNEQVVCADEDPEVAYTVAKENHPGEKVILWKVLEGETFIFHKQVRQ